MISFFVFCCFFVKQEVITKINAPGQKRTQGRITTPTFFVFLVLEPLLPLLPPLLPLLVFIF